MRRWKKNNEGNGDGGKTQEEIESFSSLELGFRYNFL